MRSRRLPNATVNRFCRFHSWIVSQGLACVAGAKRGGGRRRGEGENPLSPIPLPFSLFSLLLSAPVRSSKKCDTHIERSIWFQAFLSPQRTNVTHGQIISWIIYLNGQRFDIRTTIKFKASKGEEHFALMVCGTIMWYLSRFRRKAGLLRTFLSSALFSRGQQSRVGSLLPTEEFLLDTSLLLIAQRTKLVSSCRRIWSISSILHLFANQQIARAAKHI